MDILEVYAIYRDPLDYPGMFVVRLWKGAIPNPEPLAITLTIEAAREAIPEGFTALQRMEEDDPALFETWI